MKHVFQKTVYKNWLIWLGFALLVLFLILNRRIFTLLMNQDVEGTQAYLNHNLVYAILFMLIIMIFQNSFTVFPLVLVITINIMLFGVVQGFLWSWFSSIIAGVIVFYGVRYLFQDRLIEKFKPELLERVNENGFSYIFQARIFPLVPTSVVNILAGLSTVKFKPFFIATSIGNFIYFFMLALIPAGLLSDQLDETTIWITLIGAILLYYFIKLIFNKHKSIH